MQQWHTRSLSCDNVIRSDCCKQTMTSDPRFGSVFQQLPLFQLLCVLIVSIVHSSKNNSDPKSCGLPRKNATRTLPNNCELGDFFGKWSFGKPRTMWEDYIEVDLRHINVKIL
jgi:hypothetical protein